MHFHNTLQAVYQMEKRLDSYRIPVSVGESSNNNRAKTIQVTKQAIAYIVVYLIVYIPIVIKVSVPISAGFYIFYARLFPLQGLLNMVVYFRPKYVHTREKLKEKGERQTRIGTMLAVIDLGHMPQSMRVSVEKIIRKKSTPSTSSHGDITEERVLRRKSTGNAPSAERDNRGQPVMRRSTGNLAENEDQADRFLEPIITLRRESVLAPKLLDEELTVLNDDDKIKEEDQGASGNDQDDCIVVRRNSELV